LPRLELFRHFTEQGGEGLPSYSTFCGYLPANLVTSRKKTDVCVHCENHKRYSKRVERSPLAQDKELEAMFELHTQLRDAQRNAMKDSIKTLKEGEAVVIMDYKHNINIGNCNLMIDVHID
jgi:hypothetical protein